MKCKCLRGLIHPGFIRMNAGAKIENHPEFDFEYFKCKYCGKIHTGKLK